MKTEKEWEAEQEAKWEAEHKEPATKYRRVRTVYCVDGIYTMIEQTEEEKGDCFGWCGTWDELDLSGAYSQEEMKEIAAENPAEKVEEGGYPISKDYAPGLVGWQELDYVFDEYWQVRFGMDAVNNQNGLRDIPCESCGHKHKSFDDACLCSQNYIHNGNEPSGLGVFHWHEISGWEVGQ